MRRSERQAKHLEKCQQRGRASQRTQENARLAAAIEHRPTGSLLIFELDTHNPRTGMRHHLEIRHEIDNNSGRYNVYLDGELWRRSWSRWGFSRWLFRQIDDVRVG